MELVQAPSRPATSNVPPGALHRRPRPESSLGSARQGNRLLAALPEAEWLRWSLQLEQVEMPLGQVLYESGRCIDHVYFPSTSIVSLLNLTADGGAAEVAIVGNDGMVGVPLLMGGDSTNGRAVVQSAGHGHRLRGSVAVDEFNRGGAVMQLLLHYLQAMLTQMAQTATCNRYHSIDQQVCRLIVLGLDRVPGNKLQLTQELLASRLGVRRESVTAVALALQRDGLIRYARGHVEALDRAGLEQRACECYSVVKLESDRLLPVSEAAAASPWAHYRSNERCA